MSGRDSNHSSPHSPPSRDVRLRPVTPADLPELFQHQLDPDANRMAVVNPRDTDAFHAHWAKILSAPSITARAIVVDGELVGQISCFKMDEKDTVGYWIAKEHWGKGIATRALALLLEEVKTRPLHASAARTNAASIRVLERCGFQITGFHLSPATDRFPECEEAMFVLTGE